jgi:hypothetical protein
MLLLARAAGGIEKLGDSDQPGRHRRPKYPTFTLAQLLLLSTVFALTLAHGRLARVPPYRPTLIMQEFSGNWSPDSVAVFDRLHGERADAVQLFEHDYKISFAQCHGGGSPGGKYVELDVRGTHNRARDRSGFALGDDLERAVLTLVRARGLTVEQHLQSPGTSLAERGLSDGFTIRYRHRHTEGLIQAAAEPGGQTALVCIEERTRRNCLSIGEPHFEPRLKDW